MKAPEQAATPKAARFDPAKIEHAKSELRKEPQIIDLVAQPDQAVEWLIGVKDDGTKRYGYADYICLRLRELGAYDDRVDVRIVDFARFVANGGDHHDASLGHVRCNDGAQLDP